MYNYLSHCVMLLLFGKMVSKKQIIFKVWCINCFSALELQVLLTFGNKLKNP